MTAFYSDSICAPSPTIAQLLFTPPIQLLRLAVPEAQRSPVRTIAAPCGVGECDLVGSAEPVPVQSHLDTCANCGSAFAQKLLGRKRLTCSDRCHHAASSAVFLSNLRSTSHHCEWCGNLFHRHNYSQRVTCSGKCLSHLRCALRVRMNQEAA